MFVTTSVLLVLARTHSAALAGGVEAAGTLTWAITSPLLGAWVDVATRRRVLIVVDQLTSAVGLVAMVLLAGHAPGWTLIADAVLLNATRAFSVGSFFSLIAELAGPELLDRASAIEATSLNFSFILGPAIAGALAGAAGPAVAIYVQAALTVVVAVLMGINPVFELRPAERAARARDALRAGVRSLYANPILLGTSLAGMLAMFGWGLMIVGFPLYAARDLHAGAHAGGYLWAGLAFGSMTGTFALAGTPSLRRVAVSYAVLGISSLLWPLAATLVVGFLLVTLTGFLEGPAYSGTIALRQRHMPAAARAGAQSTLSAFTLVANSIGAALAGLLARPFVLVLAFMSANLLAAAIALIIRAPPTGARTSADQTG
jgi:MFS family permease